MAGKIFSGLAKRQKMFREELIEKRFQKRKFHYFFSIVSGFLLWVKKFARIAEPAIYVSVETFREKRFPKIHKIFHTSLVFDLKNP